MYTEELTRSVMSDAVMSSEERLTEKEVGAVIDLWVDRQNTGPRATIADVAEGLDIPIQEAKALLAEVRAAQADIQYQLTQEQKRLTQELNTLAAERKALDRAEWSLANVRTQCSQVYNARVENRYTNARRRSAKPTRATFGVL